MANDSPPLIVLMKYQSIFSLAGCFCFLFFFSGLVHGQKIGLQLYSLRNEFKTDVPGTLAKIKEWKIRQIEGGDTYGLSIVEYKKLLKKNKLKMVSYGAQFADLANNPQAVIDKAKDFGAKFIMCAWVPHKEGEFTMDDINNAITVFNTAGKLMYENGEDFVV